MISTVLEASVKLQKWYGCWMLLVLHKFWTLCKQSFQQSSEHHKGFNPYWTKKKKGRKQRQLPLVAEQGLKLSQPHTFIREALLKHTRITKGVLKNSPSCPLHPSARGVPAYSRGVPSILLQQKWKRGGSSHTTAYRPSNLFDITSIKAKAVMKNTWGTVHFVPSVTKWKPGEMCQDRWVKVTYPWLQYC